MAKAKRRRGPRPIPLAQPQSLTLAPGSSGGATLNATQNRVLREALIQLQNSIRGGTLTPARFQTGGGASGVGQDPEQLFQRLFKRFKKDPLLFAAFGRAGRALLNQASTGPGVTRQALEGLGFGLEQFFGEPPTSTISPTGERIPIAGGSGVLDIISPVSAAASIPMKLRRARKAFQTGRRVVKGASAFFDEVKALEKGQGFTQQIVALVERGLKAGKKIGTVLIRRGGKFRTVSKVELVREAQRLETAALGLGPELAAKDVAKINALLGDAIGSATGPGVPTVAKGLAETTGNIGKALLERAAAKGPTKAVLAAEATTASSVKLLEKAKSAAGQVAGKVKRFLGPVSGPVVAASVGALAASEATKSVFNTTTGILNRNKIPPPSPLEIQQLLQGDRQRAAQVQSLRSEEFRVREQAFQGTLGRRLQKDQSEADFLRSLNPGNDPLPPRAKAVRDLQRALPGINTDQLSKAVGLKDLSFFNLLDPSTSPEEMDTVRALQEMA